MRRGDRVGMNGVLLLAAAGCTSAPARPPEMPATGGREAFYQTHRLELDDGFISMTWKRRDGEYQWGQLRELAQQYPEPRRVYDKAQTRSLVVGSIAGAGGALVGYTFGYNLVADSTKEMSGTTQGVLYGTGGGLIVLGFIVSAAWRNPAKDFARVYNEALREELALPPSRSSLEASRDTTSEQGSPIYVSVLRWGGLAVAGAGAATALIAYAQYDQNNPTRAEFERQRLINNIGWSAAAVGASATVLSLVVDPSPRNDREAARCQVKVGVEPGAINLAVPF